jgi:hypothetical protein
VRPDSSEWGRPAASLHSQVLPIHFYALYEGIREVFTSAGIPVEFAPQIEHYWIDRGETGWIERRRELRAVAHAELDAKAKAAKLAIDRSEADVVTELLAVTMADEAKGRLEAMPSVNELLELQTDAGPLGGVRGHGALHAGAASASGNTTISPSPRLLTTSPPATSMTSRNTAK